MFKKAVEAKSQQRLSGADKKKLRRTLREKFPRASDADFDLLLPIKAEITASKLQNRVVLYSMEDGFPMFFDIDGRGSELFPTVYTLWKVPDIIPAFILKGGEVSHYIIGGADLMFPGINIPPEGLPEFLAGEMWAVKVPGNLAPIAVGSTTMSSSEAVKAGLRGKALRITHSYRDFLWELAEGHYVPNAGFFEDVVLEDPALCQASTSIEGVEDPSSSKESSLDNEGHESHEEGSAFREHGSVVSAETEVNVDGAEKVVAGVDDMKISDSGADELDVEDQQCLTAQDVDALLDKCLLQALHTSIKDKDLPMPGSTLWSSHVLPCRPPGITLDIKKSTHKKLSKWLQAKSTERLLKVKEDKYKKEMMLLGINHDHPTIASFKPEKRRAEKPDQNSENSSCNSGHGNTLQVVEVYKPTVHVIPIFRAVEVDTNRLFTPSEASEIVFKYVEQQNLVKPTDKSIVVLDAILCDALFKGAIKKGSMYPTEIHKKDLGSAFVSRMQANHCVTRGCHSVVRKGALKPIQIMTERRQGNKKVTRLSGLESFLLDPEFIASELQKKFACSTTVAELPGKKGYEVLVQGGVIEDLARHLIEQYGIAKRYIEVLDKTKR